MQSGCRDVTAIIKAFERPDSVLRLITSIRRFYPTLPVIIIDDSQAPMTAAFDTNTTYVHTEHDIGLSAGRNRAVALVKTKYTLLLDDDFVFTARTKIERFVDVLETTPFRIVGGRVIDFGKITRVFEGDLHKAGAILTLDLTGFPAHLQGYPLYDFVLNFFLADTALLRAHPWDTELKVREHEEFFWRLKQHHIPITALPAVTVEHYPIVEGAYSDYRMGRIAEFDRLACTKIGVEKITRLGLATQQLYGLGNYLQKLYARAKSRQHSSHLWKALFTLGIGLKHIKARLIGGRAA